METRKMPNTTKLFYLFIYCLMFSFIFRWKLPDLFAYDIADCLKSGKGCFGYRRRRSHLGHHLFAQIEHEWLQNRYFDLQDAVIRSCGIPSWINVSAQPSLLLRSSDQLSFLVQIPKLVSAHFSISSAIIWNAVSLSIRPWLHVK